MKKAIHYIVLLFLVTSYQINAQDKIWYFGDQAGIDFTGSSPVAITNSAMYALDYSAAISDEYGNILFYTNGMQVWDASHAVMQNGTGLMGQSTCGQCALIIQQPASDIFYIFTVGDYNSSAGLRYHIVDISQNGGLGAVTSKNNLLLSPSTERLDATYDPVSDSFWLVSHGWASNEFYVYNVSSTGLDINPVISSSGTIHIGGFAGNYNSMGQLCISPLNNKLVCSIYSAGIFEIFDFDVSTGVISNPVTLTGFSNAWGAAFSPDESKLYVTEWMYTKVIQMDITSGAAPTILASQMIVGHGTGPGGAYQIGYLQLAPDNKIYGAVFNDNHLLVINEPNLSGNACNVVDNGFSLNGKISQAGLCRSIKPRILNTSIHDNSSNEQIAVYPNPSTYSINISIPNIFESNEAFEYRILNLVGTEILYGTFTKNESVKVDVSEISNGIYFIQVSGKSDRLLYWDRFIKL